MTKLILSLTTIPPRFPYVGESLKGLLSQTAEIDSINLYIPKQYKRFSYDEFELPTLPEGVNLRIVPQDYGPATKVLPAVEEYKNQDVMILFCDDDKVYDTNWAQRFVTAAEERPQHVICEEGDIFECLIMQRTTGHQIANRKRNFSIKTSGIGLDEPHH